MNDPFVYDGDAAFWRAASAITHPMSNRLALPITRRRSESSTSAVTESANSHTM
jgi:hypothetical protein